ncbi:hypothetical protein N431DRAFT_503907 [Stipitochalara longipes BDJ]|nr:hypothetical protein N431DRAFT_503907 [Stipitochalara longipes BDJ]
MAQLMRRIGGHVNWGEDGPDNGTAVLFVVIFVLLMIFFALLIVWLILTIYLSRKVCTSAKRNSRPPPFSPNLTQKQIQHRAALITFTFGLILLSKSFKAKQRRDFGPPESEPGEGGSIYEYTDPQMTMHRKGSLGDRMRAFFGRKKTKAQEAEMQVLSTGFTNFEAVDAQVQVEEPIT